MSGVASFILDKGLLWSAQKGVKGAALAGLPRAVDQNSGRVLQRLEELLGEVTTNHGCIINHSADDNQPLFGWIAPLVVKKSASKNASTEGEKEILSHPEKYRRGEVLRD